MMKMTLIPQAKLVANNFSPMKLSLYLVHPWMHNPEQDLQKSYKMQGHDKSGVKWSTIQVISLFGFGFLGAGLERQDTIYKPQRRCWLILTTQHLPLIDNRKRRGDIHPLRKRKELKLELR